MGRILDGLGYAFRNVVLGRKSPYLFGLVVTDRCNLGCFYCESKNKGGYHLTAEQALTMIREAYARGHRSLYFTGGEPMLWADGGKTLADLVAEARRLGFFDVFIFTNGTFPLDVQGCNYIVTLDGPRAVHDSIRSGTFDLVLENVRGACTRAVFASITFSKRNAESVDEFVREVTATGLFRGISFNLLTHWPQIVEQHGLVGAQRVALLDRLWALKRQGYPIVLSRAAYLAMKRNDWKRPIREIELGTRERVFTCCRDVENPSVCAQCGYANCVEVRQMLSLRPSAILQVLRVVS
jgi:MoaA/NifB/PqqE/SkfB family radical SAM enzyme